LVNQNSDYQQQMNVRQKKEFGIEVSLTWLLDDRLLREKTISDLTPEASRLHILLVDDLPARRESIARKLSRFGFKNVCHGNLRRSLSDQSKNVMDLVIAIPRDLEGNVLHELALIKGNSKFSNTPVLLVLTAPKKDDLIAASQMGADVHIIGPLSTKILAQKIGNIFQKN
jgi:DNA-binding response OmpR family regulator